MGNPDPYELLFGGMEKLGPGDKENTLKVLDMLPTKDFRLVVDAGCGSGRQTLALAKALGIMIHAVDFYEIFLKDLSRRAKEKKLEHLVTVHHMNMADIPKTFHGVDLIWSEASAYNIGFSNALESWASSIKPGGFLVVSEISWIKDHVPDQIRAFWRSEYPEMHTFQENIEIIKRAGYKLLNTHLLPKDTWVNGFYDLLKPRAESLKNHANESVKKLAKDTLKEIDIFENSQDSFSYSFFVLQR